MDYEKKYNEALEKARKRVSLEPQDHIDAILKGIFPELRESEDERIRKLLVWQVHRNIEDDTNDLAGSVYDGVKGHDPDLEESIEDWKKCLAWLEKQKEQKPAEGTALQKAFIGSKIDYTLEEKCDASDYADAILPTSVAYGENEEEYKLHKIIEAAFIAGQKKEKNPTDRAFTFDDVLALESAMALAKDDKKLHGTLKSIFERVYDAYHGEQQPAEWKPEPESLEALMYAIEGKWEMIKPTSYLSRKLEDIYEGLVNTFNVDEKYLDNLPKTEYTEKDIEEIKALKEKIDSSMEQKPAKWSEEDKSILNNIIAYKYLNIDDLEWLESLPERFNLQPKQEWSEEDEAAYNAFICEVINEKMNPTIEQIKWLRSICERLKSLRPQPSWKPSEKQMKELLNAIIPGKGFDCDILTELYQQLKNL